MTFTTFPVRSDTRKNARSPNPFVPTQSEPLPTARPVGERPVLTRRMTRFVCGSIFTTVPSPLLSAHTKRPSKATSQTESPERMLAVRFSVFGSTRSTVPVP